MTVLIDDDRAMSGVVCVEPIRLTFPIRTADWPFMASVSDGVDGLRLFISKAVRE